MSDMLGARSWMFESCDSFSDRGWSRRLATFPVTELSTAIFKWLVFAAD